MDRETLLRKLDAILQEAQRTNQWGTIEIDLQFGAPVLIRETKTTKLLSEGTTRGPKYERR